jgi:CDP-4-dehydro-6-deoxyglucose reductase
MDFAGAVVEWGLPGHNRRMIRTITIAGSGRQFDAAEGETVLEAARRAGLALPYSCLAGRCASCKATLVDGRVEYPNQPPLGLSEDERAHRQVLLCQAVAVTDLVLAAREVASVADVPRRQVAAKVVMREKLADDVMRLVLRPARGERLRHIAGQYLDILLPGGKRRAFSIANAPEDDGDGLELHVRHVPGGGFTDWVFGDMPDGAVLRIEGPLGTFVPREDSERPMLFVAGGTGFAPVKAIVEHFLHLGSTRPMTLYWGVRSCEDLYQRSLPDRWAREHPSFGFVPVYSHLAPPGARAGLVHEAVLHDHADLAGHDVYMSGPPALIEAGRHAFVGAGLPEERLYYDSFEYAPDVLAAILAQRAGLDAR